MEGGGAWNIEDGRCLFVFVEDEKFLFVFVGVFSEMVERGCEWAGAGNLRAGPVRMPGTLAFVEFFVVLMGQVLIEAEGLVDGNVSVIENPVKCFLAKAEGPLRNGVEHEVVDNTESMVGNPLRHAGDQEHGEP